MYPNNKKEDSIKKQNIIETIVSYGVLLLGWQMLSMIYGPLVAPSVPEVIVELGRIVTTSTLYRQIGITCYRLVFGMTIGIGIGAFMGMWMGISRHIRQLVKPLLGILQTVPPVSWLVLALVWFGFNGRPAVFIIAVTTIPVLAIHMEEGIENINKNLLEMGKIYRFSRWKTLRHIILPSVIPYLKTALRIALGSGWKIAVMAEVLTTSDGIGGMIKLGRLNIEPASIIAWSIVIVALFYVSDFCIHRLLFRNKQPLD